MKLGDYKNQLPEPLSDDTNESSYLKQAIAGAAMLAIGAGAGKANAQNPAKAQVTSRTQISRQAKALSTSVNVKIDFNKYTAFGGKRDKDLAIKDAQEKANKELAKKLGTKKLSGVSYTVKGNMLTATTSAQSQGVANQIKNRIQRNPDMPEPETRVNPAMADFM